IIRASPDNSRRFRSRSSDPLAAKLVPGARPRRSRDTTPRVCAPGCELLAAVSAQELVNYPGLETRSPDKDSLLDVKKSPKIFLRTRPDCRPAIWLACPLAASHHALFFGRHALLSHDAMVAGHEHHLAHKHVFEHDVEPAVQVQLLRLFEALRL